MPSTVYDATKTVQDYAGLAVRYGKKAIDVRPAHYGMPTPMPNTTTRRAASPTSTR